MKSLTIGINDRVHDDFLLREIFPLKSLEALDLRVILESKGDIIRICSQLDQLRELCVNYDGVLNTADVLQIVAVATNLQWLHLRGKTDLDVNIHKELKRIVERRGENSQFVIRVWHENERVRNSDISGEWLLQIGGLQENYDGFRGYDLAVCAHTNVEMGRCNRQHENLTEYPIQFRTKEFLERIDKVIRLFDLYSWYETMHTITDPGFMY